MAKVPYIKTEGNNNIILKDISGKTIDINDIEGLKNVFRISSPLYIKDLLQQIDDNYNNLNLQNKTLIDTIIALLKEQSNTRIIKIKAKEKVLLPLVSSTVSAGFPSPAEDYAEMSIDLNEELIGNKTATFFVRVDGDSMNDANIKSGDVLIVDKSIEACHNNIVIALLEGEFTVKRLILKNKKIFLQPENTAYEPIEVKNELQIWGVVTYIIHKAL